MRLFIALNFLYEIKAQINEIIHKMESNAAGGKFVQAEHMHLTIEFLGEVQDYQLPLITKTMDDLPFGAFTLSLTQIGYFKRAEGNIYWLGVEDHAVLFHIQKQLRQALTKKGFALENRAYRPHITLGRKVKLKDHFDTNEFSDRVRKIKIDIRQVDLMKSEFKNGQLIHTVIYSKPACNTANEMTPNTKA